MSSDFKTVLIEDARIADITSEEVFGVQSGPAQSTYQQFQAVSASNSAITFNLQIPSENILVDRHVLLQSTLSFTITAGNVQPSEQVFQYGLTDSLQAFPLQSLFTTAQSTINNVSVSTNYQDVLPMLMRMNDKEMLSRFNSLTPSNPDTAYGVYKDAVLANNNPLASFSNNGYDDAYMPRGAYPVSVVIERYVNGVYTDASPISTSATTNTWKIFITGQFTEPFLALSPYINSQPACQAGLVGINSLSMTLNIDSTCKRLFSTANTFITGVGSNAVIGSYINNITLGIQGSNTLTDQQIGFVNTRLLFNFLSLQPEQYAKIATKNVVPYLDYPRYLTVSTNNIALAPSASTTLTSQSIQLNQIPDLILISARVPMSNQTWRNASGFLTINGIQVNFNNQSGLLATATQQDLYNISYRNGSAQSFYEFRGVSQNNDNASGGVDVVPTTGSLLVLNPVNDFSLPSYLSASSLGQYQFQFNLSITNQLPYGVTPEICIITVNSGVFATQMGTSQIYTGILTKEAVLRTKESNPVPALASDEYKRLVGGKMGNMGMGAIRKMVRLHRKMDGMDRSGGVSSGGVSSGGVVGSKNRLSKHLM
jgi:hypothetical protein